MEFDDSDYLLSSESAALLRSLLCDSSGPEIASQRSLEVFHSMKASGPPTPSELAASSVRIQPRVCPPGADSQEAAYKWAVVEKIKWLKSSSTLAPSQVEARVRATAEVYRQDMNRRRSPKPRASLPDTLSLL